MKSSLMSVMAETSQSAMGPYSAMAAAGSVSYALTAVCRKALVMKVCCCGGEGLGDGGGGEGEGGGGLGDGGGGDSGGDSGGLDGDGSCLWKLSVIPIVLNARRRI